MKGLLTPSQLKQIAQDRYDLYEVLVAKHTWNVIKRRLRSKRQSHRSATIVSRTKDEMCGKYNVCWLLDCLLCELYRTGELYGTTDNCGDCILGDCADYSPYGEALNGSTLACDEIIEAIEQDAHKRGVYAEHRQGA